MCVLHKKSAVLLLPAQTFRGKFEPPAKRLTAACSTAELPGTTVDEFIWVYSNAALATQIFFKN